MFAPVRFWLVRLGRIAGGVYRRSRPQLVAFCFTLVAALLLLPAPWEASAGAAKPRALPEGEVVELRSARTKTVRQPDGTLRTQLSQQSLHYVDPETKGWKEIDATFSESAKQDTKWESGDNRFSVELAATSKEDFLTLDTAIGPVTLTLEDASAVSGVKARDNVITFKDAIDGVDLEYVVLPDGLKESIVLRNKGAPSEYTFLLKPGAELKLRTEEREDGSVWFVSDEHTLPVFTLIPPVVGDSSGVAVPQPDTAIEAPPTWAAAAGKASMEVDSAGDGDFRVRLKIDEKWLADPERVFPVVLDPTLYVEPDSADGEYDTTAGGNPNMTATEIRTGRNGSGGNKYAATLNFDLATIPPSATVLDARLNANLNACFPTACASGHTGDVELRRLNTPGWSSSTPWASLSVNGSLEDKVSFTTTPTTTWHRWSSGAFTDTVQAMVSGSVVNYGFILQKTGGNDNVGYKWRSARWSDPSFAPYLEVYWVADGVQLNPSAHVRANGAEVFWQHYAGGTSNYVDAVFADSPVGYWRLDEALGDTTAWDWSGNDVTGTIQTPAGAVRAEAGALADLSYSTRFLGSTAGYVKVPDDPVVRVNNTFTLEAWIKRSDLTQRDMTIFNDFGSGYWLRLNFANRIELLANATGAPIVASTSTITDTNWHHVAVTKAGSTVKVYVDGTDVTGTVTNATLTSSTSGFHIGLTDTSTQPFYGWIDEAALYPTALTQTRVQAHFGAAPIPHAGFERFEIHRSTSAGFTPSAATLVGTVADAAAQTFSDTTAKPSTTFYYKVVTVTAEGSFVSNQLKADLPAQGQGVVTIQPGFLTGAANATHLSSGTPTTEQGNSQGLVVGSSGSNHTRTLISYYMHVVPTGATVTSAKVQMYALQSTGALNLHRVSASWTEGGATWNHRDKSQSLNWTTPGGDFDGSATASSSGGSHQHWDSWEIGSLLQQWINGTQAHNGVLIKYGSENGSQPTLVYAADGYARSIALRPKLVIAYEDGSQAVSPTVAVSQPQAGELIKGTVTVKAGALDDGSVSKVEFFLDGSPLGSPDTTAPYETAWNTTGASRGTHSLTAKATDDVGNETTSQAVQVAVANSASPTTAVTNATAGGGGVWTVTASASDDFGVEKVEFYVDGDRFATDTSSPYSVALDSLAFPAYDGSRSLTTKAYDADGNVTTSASYPITVANTSGTKYKATISTSNVPLEQSFEPGGGAQDAAPLTVSLTNTSTLNWPTASTKLRYRWYSADASPTITDSADVSIGGSDLGAGQQRNVSVTVDPPTLPTGVYRARYKLRLDLYDTGASSYFAAKGNAPYETWVTVTRKVADELGLERYQQYDGEDLGGGFDHALNLANGNSVVQWVPFSQPGRGVNSVVTMTYNSLEAGSVSPLGNNWSLSISSLTPFGLPLDVHPNAADTAAGRTQKWVGFTDADGSYHVFTGNAGGTYYTAPPGVHLYLKQTGGGGFELTKPDRTKFVYGALGYPTSVEDANGNALTYALATPAAGEDAYALARRVTTVTDAGGRAFTLTYYSKAETPTPALRGKLKRLTDHVGHALEFTYYEDGNLRSIREMGGPGDDGMPTPDREVVFTYTTLAGTGPAIATFANRQNPDPTTVQSHKLYSLIDFRGKETQFAYVTVGHQPVKWRLASRTNRTANQTTFSYDTLTRKTTATMPLSRVWKYSFDTEGRVTQIDDPVNTAHTTIEWADATAPNEVTNTVRKVTAPSGEYVEYAYNANGYKTDEWDELRNRTTFQYQNIAVDGNDVSGNWPAGRSIPHISQLAALVKPRGNATTGNPTDYRWEFAYTATGLLDTVTDPLGNVTDNAWNANGTLASQLLPANGDGITRQTTYNSYDQNGLATQVTDAAGGVAKAAYAANGNLLWEQDPNHASYSGGTPSSYRTEYRYDAHGRLVSTSKPKSTAYTPGQLVWASTVYDANDNEVSSRALAYGRGDGRNGSLTQTTFDDMDRETLVLGPRTAAQGGPVKTKTEYDAAGRVTRVTKPKGVDSAPADDYVTQTAYDLLDRESSITQHATESGATRVTNHCYDDAGDLRSVTGPKGASSFSSCPNPAATPYVYTAATHTTKFEYDVAHRQVKATDALGQITQTGYDENGQVTSETDEASKVTQTFYDDRGAKSKLVEPHDTARTLTTLWEHDPLGNVKRLISPRAFDAAGGQAPYTDYVESYSYDANSRLVKTTLPTGPSGNGYFGAVAVDSPVAYWRLGDTSGNHALDHVSPGANGQRYDSTLGQTGALAGDPDTALQCNGTGSPCVVVGPGNGKLNPNALSIELWLKTTASTTRTLVATANHGYSLKMLGSGAIWFKWTTDISNNGWTTQTAGGWNDGNWHHVVAVFENWSGTIRIYVDGIQRSSYSQGGPGSIYYSTDQVTIGGGFGGEYLTGTLDEVAIYGSALSASKVSDHYAARTAVQTTPAYRYQSYDPNGQVLETTLATTAASPAATPADQKTVMSYWDTGSIYSSHDPGATKVRFDYTAEGWQASRMYELKGQPNTLDIVHAMYWDYLPDGLLRAHVDQEADRAIYSYDANGNRVKALEGTGVVSPGQSVLAIDLAYNSLDELMKVRTPKPSSSNYLATLLSYDLHGNTTQLVDNREENGSGTQVAAGRTFTYGYDTIDRANSQLDDFATPGSATDDKLITHSFHPTGQPHVQWLQKGGAGAWTIEQSSVKTYFDNGLLKTLENRNATATLEEHTLSYIQNGMYLNGNRASDVYRIKGPDDGANCYGPTCTARWSYDARERLTLENAGAGVGTAYTLDVQGNATQQSSPGASVSRTFSAQQLQTQTQAGTTTRFIYDGRGNTDCSVKNAHSGQTCPAPGNTNLIDDSLYDERNALTGYRYYNGAASASKTIDYTVDPLERPLRQVETISGQTTTYDFTYVGITNALSKEVLTGSGATTKRYSYDVFGNRATISEGANRYSYMYDPHGSVSLLLDHLGVAKESYGYSGYGSASAALTRTAAGFNAKTNPYRYTGKRLDSGSGTYDMGARRYSASTGRFLQYDLYYNALDNLGLSEDPLTQNRYALAGANPVNFVEIDGHRSVPNRCFGAKYISGSRKAIKRFCESAGPPRLLRALYEVFVEDIVECIRGSKTACAVMVATTVGPGKLAKLARVLAKARHLTKGADRYKQHLNTEHLDAARRELRGEVVKRKADGTPYNHVHEVRDAQTGLRSLIREIKKLLSDGDLPSYVREELEAELGEASRLLDYSERFVP